MIRILFVTGVLHLATWSMVTAQDAATDQIYGSGVHAYFDGNLELANDYLSAAIEAGSRDPRAYYFRGLTHMQQGQAAEAEADFEQGALLEQGNVDRFYDVSRALERVQGRMRMALERHRTAARLAAVKELEQTRYQLYRESGEAVTVEDPVPKPRPRTFTPAEPSVTPTPTPEAPDEPDPFASEAPAASPGSTETIPAGEPAALDDPFAPEPDMPASERGTARDPFEPIRREAGEAADDPALEAVPGVDASDPFAEEEMPAETPLPGEVETPPGAAAPLDDPFAPEADLPADDLGTTRDPFESMRREAGEAADDPFMEEVPAEEAEEAPEAETPPAEQADPFSDAPAGDDPFADEMSAEEEPSAEEAETPATDEPDPFVEEEMAAEGESDEEMPAEEDDPFADP